MSDIGLVILILLLAVLTAAPHVTSHPLYLLYLAMPLYIRISLLLFAVTVVCAISAYLIRFVSQDWAGVKIEYEERKLRRRHAPEE
ncbi:MAG TPA: hypothetical protein DER58_07395 [Firmicutes bacterium]|nr:hypothetical protein [Bacillota bacterium]